MIYITGDTHSDFTRFTEEQFPIQTEMKKDDYIIICGDFGGVWTFEDIFLILKRDNKVTKRFYRKYLREYIITQNTDI